MSEPTPMPPAPSSASINLRSIVGRFIRDVTWMPRWHKGVLGAALAAVILGWAHFGYRAVADANSNATSVQQAAPTTQPAPSAFGTWTRRTGGSVLIAFVIGWIFRTFIKIMASITALVLGGILLLSYFNFFNVDFTTIKKDYSDSSSWVAAQATHLRDAAMSHVHSTLGGGLGLFIGLRKKKMPAV